MPLSLSIPSSPKHARAIGATHYKGSPCVDHPEALRYTHNKACIECERTYAKVRRATMADSERARRKAWKLANPTAHKASKARWQTKNRARRNAQSLARNQAKRDAPLARALRDAVRNNKAASKVVRALALQAARDDRARELQAMRYAASMIEGTRGQPLTLTELRNRVKRGKHRAKARGLAHNLRARELADIGDAQGWKCAHCGAPGELVLDHIRPLSKGGTHSAGNVQWLCPFHNDDKRDRLESDYRRLRAIPLATPWDVL